MQELPQTAAKSIYMVVVYFSVLVAPDRYVMWPIDSMFDLSRSRRI